MPLSSNEQFGPRTLISHLGEGHRLESFEQQPQGPDGKRMIALVFPDGRPRDTLTFFLSFADKFVWRMRSCG